MFSGLNFWLLYSPQRIRRPLHRDVKGSRCILASCCPSERKWCIRSSFAWCVALRCAVLRGRRRVLVGHGKETPALPRSKVEIQGPALAQGNMNHREVFRW